MARVEEALPYKEINTDQSPNRGAYRTSAAVDCVTVGFAIDPDRWPSIAQRLMKLADAAQAELRHDAGVNRMDKSHTNALRMVCSVAKQIPIEDDLAEWCFKIALVVRDMVSEVIGIDDQASDTSTLTSRINHKIGADQTAMDAAEATTDGPGLEIAAA